MSKRAEKAKTMTRFEEHLERILDAYNGLEIDTESAAKIHAPTLLNLALTWQDIKDIDEWICAIQTSDDLQGQDLYEEVLKRFNESKKSKK